MAAETNNYVVGRGKLYFSRFAVGALAATGFKYFGNTPELMTSQSSNALDHYSSDEGMKVKDKSVDLSNDMSGSFTCDNISTPNLALFFIGDEAQETITSDSAVAATGTITLTGTGTAADTVTINGQVITFEAAGAVGPQINIGVSAMATAQNLKTLINDNPSVYGVTATGAAAILTLHAEAPGLSGNAITLAKASTGVTISGATLTGGTDSPTETIENVVLGDYYPLGVTDSTPAGVRGVSNVVVTDGTVVTALGNYEIDADTGLLRILPDATDIIEGDTLTVAYDVAAGTRTMVIGANDTIYGALRFYSFNAEGRQKDYFWPYVKVSPNGDLNLKGDDWQTVGFKFDVLKLNDATGRVYIDDRG